jgi:hypothetical protein
MTASPDNSPPRERPNIFAPPAAEPGTGRAAGWEPAAVFAVGAAGATQTLPTVGLDSWRPRLSVRGGRALGRFAITAIIVCALAGSVTLVARRVWVSNPGQSAESRRPVERHPGAAHSYSGARATREPRDLRSARPHPEARTHRRRRHHVRSARPRTAAPAPSWPTSHPSAANGVPRPSSSLPVPSAPRAPARPAPVPAGAPPEFL